MEGRGLVPDERKLMPAESKDALYKLIDDIRGAETLRELRLHMRRSVEYQRDVRDFFTRIETECLSALDRILDGEDAATRSNMTDDLRPGRESRERREHAEHTDH